MARLLALALAEHPRIGPSFAVRFSWNARLENPIERVKQLPALEREYDPAHRRWWIAAAHLDLLADLFENWQEEIAALAAANPQHFSAVITRVMQDRVHAAISEVMDAAPVVSGDDMLAAVGGAIGRRLEEWCSFAPDASTLSASRLHAPREAARHARAQWPGWVQRAAFVHEFLAPPRTGTPDG